MKSLKTLALLLAILPTQALANAKLSERDLQYLIKTCFQTLYHPGGQPFQVDRKRLSAMGFSSIKDDTGAFKAQRVLSEKIMRFKKVRFGPMFEARRNKKKPSALLHKLCTISGGGDGVPVPFTNVSGAKAQSMLEVEAKRLGFKPFGNNKGKVVWIKGDVAVFLTVTFPIKRGGAVDPKQPVSYIYVDGVHPKNLRGIKS